MIYDISFPLSPETMVYPGDPPFCGKYCWMGQREMTAPCLCCIWGVIWEPI